MPQAITAPTNPPYALPLPPEPVLSLWQQVDASLSQSMNRALVQLAHFLPGILALLIAVLLMSAVGALLSVTLRRILRGVRFDDHLNRNNTAGVSDFSPSNSPTLLVTRVAFWGCVVLGFVIAFRMM